MADSPRRLKSCDTCKSRKVRCNSNDNSISCDNCIRRNVSCHYSFVQKPRRRSRIKRIESNTARLGISPSPAREEATNVPPIQEESQHGACGDAQPLQMPKFDGLQELFIDRLLVNHPCSTLNTSESIYPKGLGVIGNDFSLTFFSESRLESLAARLGHRRVNDVVEKVASIISDRMKAFDRVPTAPEDRTFVLDANKDYTAACIKSYFDRIHPLYPFLDRQKFNTSTSGPQIRDLLTTDKAWSALYYTVLALGCQYHDGGSYLPGKKMAWRFFSIALSLFPDLLIARSTLLTVQAITAMAIFTSTISCMQLAYVMVSEGAKKAQNLGYNKATSSPNDPRSRIFWVLYCQEKLISFTIGRSSVLMDSDISCPIQPSPQIQFDNFDWLLAFARHARLLSRVYTSLYSVSAAGKSVASYRFILRQLMAEVEAWRLTIPSNLRPSEAIKPLSLRGEQMIEICIMVNYLYYTTMLALHRTAFCLELDTSSGDDPLTSIRPREESMQALMRTARTVLELTRYIEVEPYTPLWVLVGVPVHSMFLLFDLVVHNPTHPETASNLALLDVGGGHFSRIEYKSQGTLPGSLAAEFAHIARHYVRDRSTQESFNQSSQQLSSPAAPIQPQPGTDSPLQPRGNEWNTAQWLYHSQPAPGVEPEPLLGNLDAYNQTDGFSGGTDIMEMFSSFIPGVDETWF